MTVIPAQQQGITWATPGTLHSPALLATQNQPIFIRGAQPGQENVFISNPQPQTMHAPNSKFSNHTFYQDVSMHVGV